MNRGICLLYLLSALTLAAAGCGSDGSTSGEVGGRTTAPDTSTTATSEAEEKDRPKKGAWGVVFGVRIIGQKAMVYDLAAHALYAFEKDRGTTSTCYGDCARTWPPALTEGKARAGGSAHPRMVGTTKRKDGTIQLTYAGHPLYRYYRDRQAELKGQGRVSYGGEWYALSPNGERLQP